MLLAQIEETDKIVVKPDTLSPLETLVQLGQAALAILAIVGILSVVLVFLRKLFKWETAMKQLVENDGESLYDRVGVLEVEIRGLKRMITDWRNENVES